MRSAGGDASSPSSAADAAAVHAIHLCGVRKTYALGARRVEALRGVDLEIGEPGFFALMGPSGSGKTTLLHLLAGLDRPDSGSIDVAGRRVDRLSETELTLYRRHQIGIVFQQFNLISTLSALDNVTLPAMLDGMPRHDRRRRAETLLDQLGLRDRLDHRPDALSGGEQQRVAIARALMFEPPVILADEPTGNLDSRTSEELWGLLDRLAAERRITVLMVTHEASAATHCQRVYLMRDGLIHASLDVEGLDAGELARRVQQPLG